MEKKNTKQAILEAAEAEFLEMGFHGAKTASIAKRAGVTHAMLHYYFSTKEKLFDIFIETKMQVVKNIIFPVLLAEKTSVIERIRLVVDRQFEYIRAYPYLPKFILNEVLSKPERFRQMITNMLGPEMESFAKIQEDINKEAAEGRIRPVKLPDLILDILSLNMVTFIAAPVAAGILPGTSAIADEFINARKEEIIETITRRLTV